ncbi:VirB6/TrbL-like conjugal transfer protein, CD1112 family, partial [Streptococcus suis]
QSPNQFNAEVFSFIKHINESVVLPIAGLVITAVLCLELIQVVMHKNNMAEVDTFEFFKYVIKMWVALYLVSHAFEFCLAAFDMGQQMILQAS